VVGQPALEKVADLATKSGFDFVRVANSSFLYVSVIPDQCTNKLDLIFLVDGSDSIPSADFGKVCVFFLYFPSFFFSLYFFLLTFARARSPHQARNFINDVISYFDIGPNETRVGVATFSGFGGHISTINGLPDCPVGTFFEQSGYGCICAPTATCSGPVYNPFLNILSGCRNGQLGTTGQAVKFYDHSCNTCSCQGAVWGGGPSAGASCLPLKHQSAHPLSPPSP
jgi:hypothetical protein